MRGTIAFAFNIIPLAVQHEHLKTMPEAHEKTPVVAPATTAPKRKKKRIAAPNPLSCQKKKKNTAKMTKDKKDASVTMIEDKKKKADASLAVAVAVAEGEAMKEGDTVAASSQVSTGNALAKKRRRRPHRSHKNGTDSGTPRAETPDTPR